MTRGASIFTGVALLALSACSKPDSRDKPLPVASISIGTTGPATGAAVDAAQLEKLGNAVAACKMKDGTDFGIEPKCPELKAFDAARGTLTVENQKTTDRAVAPKLLASSAGPVRALGATYLSTVTGADAASSEKIADAMVKETDPSVLSHMIRMAAPVADKSPKVAAATVGSAGHSDKGVRFHAAVVLANANVSGGTTKMLELAEKDPDQEVRDIACSSLGHHGEAALTLLEKLTADVRSPGYAPCFIGLVRQWASPPQFDTQSEKAYRLTLQRLGQKPRGDRVPPHTALTLIGSLGEDSEAAKAWLKNHAWFKTAPLVKVLGDVVTDRTTGYAPRFGAVDAAVRHGATKSDLESWRKTFGATPDEVYTTIAKKLDDEIAKKKKE